MELTTQDEGFHLLYKHRKLRMYNPEGHLNNGTWNVLSFFENHNRGLANLFFSQAMGDSDITESSGGSLWEMLLVNEYKDFINGINNGE